MKKFYNMEFGTYKEQGDSVILEINKNNLKKFDDYSELISNLNRQLETDIIVEY